MITFSSTIPCAAVTKTAEKSILSHNSRARDQCIRMGESVSLQQIKTQTLITHQTLTRNMRRLELWDKCADYILLSSISHTLTFHVCGIHTYFRISGQLYYLDIWLMPLKFTNSFWNDRLLVALFLHQGWHQPELTEPELFVFITNLELVQS